MEALGHFGQIPLGVTAVVAEFEIVHGRYGGRDHIGRNVIRKSRPSRRIQRDGLSGRSVLAETNKIVLPVRTVLPCDLGDIFRERAFEEIRGRTVACQNATRR